MNVIIPFRDLDADVQDSLKAKCIRDGKTLRQVAGEILNSALMREPIIPAPVPKPAAPASPTLNSSPTPTEEGQP